MEAYADVYGTFARIRPATELEARLKEQPDIIAGRRPVPPTSPEPAASGPSVASAGAPAENSEEQMPGSVVGF